MARSILRTSGNIAQAAGLYRMGHIIRAASAVGVGSDMGMAAMAANIAGVTAALGGLVVAAKLVSVGFGALEKSATAMAGAIAKIGGARGLEEMIVESVSNTALANQARFSVSANQRFSTSEMMTMAQGLSHNVSAGAFATSDWLKTIRGIGIETGSQASLSQDTLKFIGQFASVSGMSLEESGSIFSRLKKQNMSMSDQSLINAMLAGHAIGQTGSFDIKELPEAGKLLQLESQLGGSGSDRIQELMTVGTLLKQGGASNLTVAGTQMAAFLRQGHLVGGAFKYGANEELTNLPDVLKYLVSTPQSEMNQHLLAGRSRNFVNEIQAATSERAGVFKSDFRPEAISKRKAVIDEFERLGMTMEQFRKEFEESLTPQQRFGAAFNRISDELEGKFYEVLISLEPTIDTLALTIHNNSKEIGSYFAKIASYASVLVTVMPQLASVVTGLATAIGGAIVWFAKLFSGVGSAKEADEKLVQLNKSKETAERLLSQNPNDLYYENLQKINKEIEDTKVYKSMFESIDKLSPENLSKMKEKVIQQQEQDRKDAEAVAESDAFQNRTGRWAKDDNSASGSTVTSIESSAQHTRAVIAAMEKNANDIKNQLNNIHNAVLPRPQPPSLTH